MKKNRKSKGKPLINHHIYWYKKYLDILEINKKHSISDKEYCNHKEYCNNNDLDYSKYTNCKFAFSFIHVGDEQFRQECLEIKNAFIQSGLTQEQYALSVGIRLSILNVAINHIKLLDDLEKENNESKEENDLNFVPLKNMFKSKQTELEHSLEQPLEPIKHQLITCQNDIEITIRAGIKVTLGQNIGMDKIMKIVELLRAL